MTLLHGNGHILTLDSIAKKLSIILLITITIVFSLTGTLIYSHTKELLVKEIEDSLATKSSAIAEQVNALFNDKGTLVRQITTNQDIVNYLKTAKSRDEALTNPYYNGVNNSLEAIKKTDDKVAMVWVASEKGNFLVGTGGVLTKPDFNIQERPWHKPALATEDIYYSDPYMDQVFGKVILSVMKQVKDGSNTVGIVAVDLFLDSLPQIMQSYKIGDSGYTFLLAPDGNVIYHPNKGIVMKEKLPSMEGDLGAIAQKMVSGEKGLKLALVNDREEYIGYSPVPVAHWSVAASTPVKEALSPLGQFSNSTLLYYIVSIFILVALVYFLLNYMLRGISYVSEVIKQLSTGDLTPRLNIRSKDELGQVAHDMNEMLETFSETIRKVHMAAEQMAASSEQLTATSVDSVQASNHIAASIEEVVRGNKSQLMGVEQTSKAMEEMATGILKIVESASLVSEASIASVKEVEVGNNAIQEAVRQMKHIRDSVGETAADIKLLEEHSQKIGDIVAVITDISKQTQLLSLNASIEAARAGEHGRGFAVVANEVNKLAEQSKKSAEHISNLIKDVQVTTLNAVNMMNRGVADVEKGELVIDKAGDVFSRITGVNQSIADQIQEVSATLEEISAGTEEVSASMGEMVGVTQTSFTHSQGITSAAEEQLASMQEISSAAEDLSNTAQELQEALAQFKIRDKERSPGSMVY